MYLKLTLAKYLFLSLIFHPTVPKTESVTSHVPKLSLKSGVPSHSHSRSKAVLCIESAPSPSDENFTKILSLFVDFQSP